MANKPLQPVSLTAPGYFGLNDQDSPVTLDQRFATLANNGVIDKFGRIAARKGWSYRTSSGGTASTPEMIFEFDNYDGTYTIISAGNNKIFTGETTMTQAAVKNATNTGNATVTITDNDWQFVQAQFESGLNRSAHGFMVQKGHPALVYHKLPSTGTGAEVTVNSVASGKITAVTVSTAGSGYAVNDLCTVTGGTGADAEFTVTSVDGTGGVTGVSITEQGDGYTNSDVLVLVDTDYHSHENSFGFQRLFDINTAPAGYSVTTFMPNCALGAWGRLFLADIGSDELTVYYSVQLDPANFTGAGSGVLNIEKVVPGADKIVALAAHNNFLIIFCEKNIVIYAGLDDIGNSLTLSDVIVGTGCIARDSVQVTGSDVVFLSDDGLMSLGRVIQEKSAPMRDLSRNVRDSLITYVKSEDKEKIRSVYFENEAFYLLVLPSSTFTFCFDVRAPLENGAFRATKWDAISPRSVCATRDRRLLLGKTDGIALYDGYTDNSANYIFSYFGPYLDFGVPFSIKALKKINVVVIGGNDTTLDIKWAFDYSNNFSSVQKTTKISNIAQYGIAEYGIAEYSQSIAIEQFTRQLSGNGTVLQLGIDAAISGAPLSIQKIDVYSVIGRTR
jgi:hypothetical protein